jgi:hypothetical protein
MVSNRGGAWRVYEARPEDGTGAGAEVAAWDRPESVRGAGVP